MIIPARVVSKVHNAVVMLVPRTSKSLLATFSARRITPFAAAVASASEKAVFKTALSAGRRFQYSSR